MITSFYVVNALRSHHDVMAIIRIGNAEIELMDSISDDFLYSVNFQFFTTSASHFYIPSTEIIIQTLVLQVLPTVA